MANQNGKATMEMHTLVLCREAQYVRTIACTLKPLGVSHTVLEDCAPAVSRIAVQKFETIVVDGREIDDVAEFLCAVRRSNLDRDCILVAIVRDRLDLRQAPPRGRQNRCLGQHPAFALGAGGHPQPRRGRRGAYG
jgi:hypothetical protein